MFSLYGDDGGGGDDVDVDIADDTKVSFLSIFHSPQMLGTMFLK